MKDLLSVTIANLYDEVAGLDGTSGKEYTKQLAKSVVGSLVRFEVKGGKYVFTEFYDRINDDVKSTRTGNKKLVYTGSSAVTYKEDTMKLGSYRLTESTNVMLVKAKDGTKSKAAYSVDVEVINAADLGNGDYHCFISGINDATFKVENVVIYLDEASRTTNKDYAVILDYSTLTNDDDYKSEVKLSYNGKNVNIASYCVKAGDEIAVKESKKENKYFTEIKQMKVGNMPKWLEFNPETLVGKVIALPTREDIDSQIAEHMIVELYSK